MVSATCPTNGARQSWSAMLLPVEMSEIQRLKSSFGGSVSVWCNSERPIILACGCGQGMVIVGVAVVALLCNL